MTRINGHGPGGHFAPPVEVNPFFALSDSMNTLVDQFNTLAHSADVRVMRRMALEMDQHMNCVRSDLSAVLVALAAYPLAGVDRSEVPPQTTDSGGTAAPDE